jgi:hypothetical protein
MRRLVEQQGLLATELTDVRWADVDTPDDRASAERLAQGVPRPTFRT